MYVLQKKYTSYEMITQIQQNVNNTWLWGKIIWVSYVIRGLKLFTNKKFTSTTHTHTQESL